MILTGKRPSWPPHWFTTWRTVSPKANPNKKSLPNGKPFIGEHPSMLQPDSNPWDRNPTQQDKDMVIFPEKTTTDFVYIIFWIISFFLDLFHNLVFLFG
jgi:hypothetical protein